MAGKRTSVSTHGERGSAPLRCASKLCHHGPWPTAPEWNSVIIHMIIHTDVCLKTKMS